MRSIAAVGAVQHYAGKLNASIIVASDTVAAVEDQIWVLDSIRCSFGNTPESVVILWVVIGGVTVFTTYMLRAGTHRYAFPGGLHRGVLNESLWVGLLIPAGVANATFVFTYR